MNDRRPRRLAGRLTAAAGLAAAACAVALLATGYTSAVVGGEAMEPTYPRGDRVFFERVDASEVRRGDVVLHGTEGAPDGRPLLRRVIGTGGDHVSQIPGGPVTVNGRPLTEPYVKDGDPSGTAPAYDVVVPEGRLFLLGDHRANSNDSRFSLAAQAGSIPATAVRARALDSHTGPALLALTALLGLLAAAGGLTREWASRRSRRGPAR
ncbi:signal peptidase I [Streptomyces sp. NPDC093089]|uniref:signal peptidase I n=1 Tax=Streptomyces sp. NPDC093089 TaxID=3366024 RepID=UPI0038206BDE